MKSLFTIVLLQCLLLAGMAVGQGIKERPEHKALRLSEAKRYQAMMRRQVAETAAESRIDVIYYLLDVRITSSPQYIRGKVQMNASVTQNSVASLTLDLMNSLHIDSVLVGRTPVEFTQHSSTFDITLDRAYENGENIQVTTYYQGVPGSSGFGSFEFSSHSGKPWVWTLSEPYGAKDWWPCKDHPSDKADSADIIVTCNQPFSVGSEGKLVSVVNHGDSTVTYHWQERYPISTYLVSAAITNYAHFSNWFKYSPTDSMEVLNYVLPEYLANARSTLSVTPAMIGIFSDAFGLYPFIKEKYGHSEFGWGGAMEHQTMTSITGAGGYFDEWTIAHELAHQWFGDMITCRTWSNIWLNEGFATFCEGLYEERTYGREAYVSWVAGVMSGAAMSTGSIYITDTSDVGHLFDGNLVYNKGAAVLTMLRHMLGDSAFFHAMYNYANTPALRYGTATTEDFKAACQAASGTDLGEFFDQWVYGENFPAYYATCSMKPIASGFRVTTLVRQHTSTVHPQYFTMPLDVQFAADGWDTTATFLNSAREQTFSVDLSHIPTALHFDPEQWILMDRTEHVTFTPFAVQDSLGCGIITIGQARKETLTVFNFGTTRIIIKSVTSDSPDFTVSPAIGYIPVGETEKFVITFQPGSIGEKSGHLAFLTTDSDVPYSVAVRGISLPQGVAYFSASRDSLDFGPVRIGATRIDSIEVENTGTVPLVIASMGSSMPDFHVVPSSATLPSGGRRTFQITFTPFSGGPASGTITVLHNGANSPGTILVKGEGGLWNNAMHVETGWNLVSLPYEVGDARRVTIFPASASNLFSYSSGLYTPQESLTIGNGYWLKFPAGQDLNIAGVPRTIDSVAVTAGWNLIGSLSAPVSVDSITAGPPGMITSKFYGYFLGYQVADTLQPAKGYWVKVAQNGMLFLSTGSTGQGGRGR